MKEISRKHSEELPLFLARFIPLLIEESPWLGTKPKQINIFQQVMKDKLAELEVEVPRGLLKELFTALIDYKQNLHREPTHRIGYAQEHFNQLVKETFGDADKITSGWDTYDYHPGGSIQWCGLSERESNYSHDVRAIVWCRLKLITQDMHIVQDTWCLEIYSQPRVHYQNLEEEFTQHAVDLWKLLLNYLESHPNERLVGNWQEGW